MTDTIPIAPKRGQLLLAIMPDRGTITAGGIIIPGGGEQALDVAEVLALGKPPYDIRTGEPREWDYAVGDRVILNKMAERPSLPFTHEGRELSLVSDGHIWGLWVAPVEQPVA